MRIPHWHAVSRSVTGTLACLYRCAAIARATRTNCGCRNSPGQARLDRRRQGRIDTGSSGHRGVLLRVGCERSLEDHPVAASTLVGTCSSGALVHHCAGLHCAGRSFTWARQRSTPRHSRRGTTIRAVSPLRDDVGKRLMNERPYRLPQHRRGGSTAVQVDQDDPRRIADGTISAYQRGNKAVRIRPADLGAPIKAHTMGGSHGTDGAISPVQRGLASSADGEWATRHFRGGVAESLPERACPVDLAASPAYARISKATKTTTND